MRAFYPHAFINMWLWYEWAPRSYWVKCWVILEFSDKTRKTSCINRSIHHHGLNEQPNEWRSLYALPLSSLIQWFSDPLTVERRHALSLSHTSPTECHWVRRCQEVDASFCLTCFVLSLSHTRTTPSVVWHPSTVWWMQVSVHALYVCVCVCVSLLFYHAEGQSPCERPSAALDVLWWRSDGERWKETHLDRFLC